MLLLPERILDGEEVKWKKDKNFGNGGLKGKAHFSPIQGGLI